MDLTRLPSVESRTFRLRAERFGELAVALAEAVRLGLR